MLRLFGEPLSPAEAANLCFLLESSKDPDARAAGAAIADAFLHDPFANVTLTNRQRTAVKDALQDPPESLNGLRNKLAGP